MYLQDDYVVRSVQYSGRFSPGIILFFPMLLPLGNPIESHEEFSSLEPIFPPKRFDMFPLLIGWILGRFSCVHISLKIQLLL